MIQVNFGLFLILPVSQCFDLAEDFCLMLASSFPVEV